MFDLILYAAQFFVALLVVEWLTFRHTGDHDRDRTLRGYSGRDTATSLSMGTGNLVINLGWKLVVVAIYSGVYELTPLRVPSDAWWAWVLLFSPTTRPTTGFTASATRCGCSGPATSCTTPASTTTFRPPCARRGCR